jgi:hypothetical protein
MAVDTGMCYNQIGKRELRKAGVPFGGSGEIMGVVFLFPALFGILWGTGAYGCTRLPK